MAMPNINLLSVTPIYLALLGLMFLPFTLRVRLYRVNNDGLIGDGSDPGCFRDLAARAGLPAGRWSPAALYRHDRGQSRHWQAGRRMMATTGVFAVTSIWILVDVL